MIIKLITERLTKALANTGLDPKFINQLELSHPKDEKFGDFSTNIAMLYAKKAKRSPIDLAKQIVDQIKNDPIFSSVEYHPPGFINITLKSDYWLERLVQVIDLKDDFGRIDYGKNEKLLIEFVSANPTGPLHIGHGRGAAIGDSLRRILSFAGYDVTSEYYLNDAGLQIENLGRSLLYRAAEKLSKDLNLELTYKGDYMIELADRFLSEFGNDILDVEDSLTQASTFAADSLLALIKDDLAKFNVSFDNWFSEKSLHDTGRLDEAVHQLMQDQFIYENEGALWLKTTLMNDEHDRVVKRSNGIYTYLASDIAYHKSKYDRNFTRLVDIFGADHHGYLPRMETIVAALGKPKDSLTIRLIQIVNIKRSGEIESMSTRSGKFTALSDIVDEVGTDSCRYFFLSRSADAQMDFDIDLAKHKGEENPLFYIQYSHARAVNILANAADKNMFFDPDSVRTDLLNDKNEMLLVKKILELPEQVLISAKNYSPSNMTGYLKELATAFHRFYKFNRVLIDEDKDLTNARLLLVKTFIIAVRNGLNLLGISAPDKM